MYRSTTRKRSLSAAGFKASEENDNGEPRRKELRLEVNAEQRDDRPKLRDISNASTFNTVGTSGSAVVNNVGGHYINYSVYLAGNDEICRWLAAPDPSKNYHAAREAHHTHTGSWFTRGEVFLRWKDLPDHPLWVHGPPGCGKTIICSTAIEDVAWHCEEQALSACAYFFFDNRNAEGELSFHEKFVHSLILQLWHQLGRIPAALMGIYGNGPSHPQPSLTTLQNTLQATIGEFQHVYIIIDALDECVDKERLLLWFKEISHWQSGKLHMLLSSRQERGIEDHIVAIARLERLSLAGGSANPDITKFLDGSLSRLKKWAPETRAIVRDTLLEGADGSFRWVALQYQELSQCSNLRSLKQQLRALPKDIEETYQRLLCNSSHPDDLRTFLIWVAFSARPIKFEELAEVVTVDFRAGGKPCYDHDLRYMDSGDVLAICSGFVTEFEGVVKLAHMSVKEYLLSDKILGGAAAHFKINAGQSHALIVQTCLAYLLRFGILNSLSDADIGTFPLARYAAAHWTSHLQECSGISHPQFLQALITHLFVFAPNAFANWMWLISLRTDRERLWERKAIDELSNSMATPLYMAGLLGLDEVVKQLVPDIYTSLRWSFKALYGAACEGHHGVVKLLLEHASHFLLGAATVYSESPLVVAASRGRVAFFEGDAPTNYRALWSGPCHAAIMRLLFDTGMNVRFRGGAFAAAPQEDSRGGQEAIVRLLLQNGVAVNGQDCTGRTALHYAAYGGREVMVRLLLDSGADLTVRGRKSGTALQDALERGHEAVARMLLEHGAKFDVQRGEFGTALQSASRKGREAIVRLLFKYDPDAIAQGGPYGTALYQAAERGQEAVVRLFLEHGIDANIQGGPFGTALCQASATGDEAIVRLLLDHGADVNIGGGAFGTALCQASEKGQDYIVRLLLEHHADANIQGARCGTALQTASWNGHETIVRLLLEHGADINWKGEYFGTALCQAIWRGHEAIARLLLASGAEPEVHPRGGILPPSLRVAIREQHEWFVALLHSYGAEHKKTQNNEWGLDNAF